MIYVLSFCLRPQLLFTSSSDEGGDIKIIDDHLFVSAQASIDQQIVDNGQAVSAGGQTDNDNRATVQSYLITPYLLNNFGSWVDSELRTQIAFNRFSRNVASNSIGNNVNLILNSGRRFTRLTWTLSALHDKIDRNGSQNSTEDTVEATLTYNINSQFSLIGTFGAEDIDDDTLNDSPSGPFWTVGFDYSPSRRLQVGASIGDRFERTNYGFDLTYQISDRSTATANFTREITSSQRNLSNNVSNLGTDEFGNQIDTSTGLPFDSSNPSLIYRTIRSFRTAFKHHYQVRAVEIPIGHL